MPSEPHYDSLTKDKFIGAVQKDGIHPSVASHVWKKFQQTGSTHALPQSGHPSIVTNRLEHEIVCYSRSHHCAPLWEISSAVSTRVSKSTVWNVLGKHKIHWRCAYKAVFLTNTYKQAQKAWALWCKKQMKKGDWWHVIWSNKCYIYIGDSKGTVWVTQTYEEEFDENCLVPTFKQSSI